jgi:hypothetical protein
MRDTPCILSSLLCRHTRGGPEAQRVRATWVLHGQCMWNSSAH